MTYRLCLTYPGSLLGTLIALTLIVTACAPAAPSADTPRPADKPATSPTSAPAKPSQSPASAASPAASPAVAAPSPAASKPAAGAPTETVKVVHVPSTLFAPLYVALEKGYFREQGIEVQLDRAQAGQDAVALIAAGQLDVLVAGFSAATFNASNRGLDFRIVTSMGRQPEKGLPSALMVRDDLLKSGEVKEIKDLKGKKVAISGGKGAAGGYWVATKLRDGGLTLNDIEVVNLGFPEMVTAFGTNAIDAAFPPAPFTTRIKDAGSADFFGGPIQPGASAVGTTFGGPFMKSRPEVARRVMVALVKGARDVQGDGYLKTEHLAAYSKHTGTAVDILRQIDAYQFDPNLTPDEKTLMDMQQVFIREGVLTLKEPIPAEKFIDASFTRAAAEQLGPYQAR